MSLSIGTRLGPYEIVSAVGMGEVYRARDTRLEREVIDAVARLQLARATDFVPFQNKVRVAEVAVRGFLLDFVNSDHHINVVEVSTNLGVIEGEIVHFRVDCQYADRNFDDQFSGFVDVLVIADLVDG